MKTEINSERGKDLHAPNFTLSYFIWGTSFEILQFTFAELDVASYSGDWFKKVEIWIPHLIPCAAAITIGNCFDLDNRFRTEK